MKKIALVDCDNFFASCEQLVRPELNGKAVCVTGHNGGVVIARSQEAKNLGVEMAMPYFKAKKVFSNAEVHFIPCNFTLYHTISKRIIAILKQYSPDVEQYSIDEAFVDLSGVEILHKKNVFDICKEIKSKIKTETGIDVSIGLSSTKTLAKLACLKSKKSADVHSILNSVFEELESTPIKNIWGVGKRLEERLAKFGIKTAKEYVGLEDDWLKKNFTIIGLNLKYELLGYCVYPVLQQTVLPKSLQKTNTFVKSTSDKEFLRFTLHYHCARVCKKLRKLGLYAFEIEIMLKDKDFKYYTLHHRLSAGVNSELELVRHINEMFEKIYDRSKKYRASGISALKLNLVPNIQLNLLSQDMKHDKSEKIGKVIDKIDEKYGKNFLKVGNITIEKTEPFEALFHTL